VRGKAVSQEETAFSFVRMLAEGVQILFVARPGSLFYDAPMIGGMPRDESPRP